MSPLGRCARHQYHMAGKWPSSVHRRLVTTANVHHYSPPSADLQLTPAHTDALMPNACHPMQTVTTDHTTWCKQPLTTFKTPSICAMQCVPQMRPGNTNAHGCTQYAPSVQRPSMPGHYSSHGAPRHTMLTLTTCTPHRSTSANICNTQRAMAATFCVHRHPQMHHSTFAAIQCLSHTTTTAHLDAHHTRHAQRAHMLHQESSGNDSIFEVHARHALFLHFLTQHSFREFSHWGGVYTTPFHSFPTYFLVWGGVLRYSLSRHNKYITIYV